MTKTNTHVCTHACFSTAPSAPLNLVADVVTAFSVSLQWNEPQPTNGIIRRYIVQYYQTSTPAPITLLNDSIQMTSAMVINLSPFTDYTFRVSAVTVAEGPFVEVDAMTPESSMTHVFKIVRYYIHSEFVP